MRIKIARLVKAARSIKTMRLTKAAKIKGAYPLSYIACPARASWTTGVRMSAQRDAELLGVQQFLHSIMTGLIQGGASTWISGGVILRAFVLNDY